MCFSASVAIYILAAQDDRIYFAAPWTRVEPVYEKTYAETNSINFQIMTLRATDPTIPETVSSYREVPGTDPGDYFEVQGSEYFCCNLFFEGCNLMSENTRSF